LEAILALEDGRFFRGRAFGAVGERFGEVVFNTSMTGYQEVLTDPSYHGQVVVMTSPQIGNVGTNPLDHESKAPTLAGFAVRELSRAPSNWRANQALHEYMREHGVPGITELDTRALTRHIRIGGAIKGAISCVDRDPESLIDKARRSPALEEQDLVGEVTCEAPHEWRSPRDPRWSSGEMQEAGGRRRCVAYDFGAKETIFRLLWESGFDVTVVPATLPAAEALALRPDAAFLSNGPGDPAAATYAVATVRELIGKVPIFGICLGHQIAALATGAKTFKLKFGHRGANHPVKDLRTGRVAVTSQNHGYAVDPDTLPSRSEVTHVNLNDNTCEGFLDEDTKLLAVQYHPESSPGPHDSFNLFHNFVRMTVGG
jgi:carbamoyl-phosphate synthase small subunit